MPAELNFFDTYTLMAVQKRIVPKQTFFRDRYFPTEEGDIFSSNKVLTEYMDGDRKMAAFVSPRVGAIPMERISPLALWSFLRCPRWLRMFWATSTT